MSGNIQPVEFRRSVNEDAISALEEFLAMAKSGELTSIAMCGVLLNGQVASTFSSTPNRILEIAAISRLLHNLHLNLDHKMAGK